MLENLLLYPQRQPDMVKESVEQLKNQDVCELSESARAERDRLMRLAVNRTLRLFRGARSLSGGELTSSKYCKMVSIGRCSVRFED